MGEKISKLPDLFLTIPIILLLSLSILVIYSSDPSLALQQAIFAFVGLVIYFFLATIKTETYSHYGWFLYGLVLILLIVVFIIGEESRGSVRWISLGLFQLQPSELAKPIMILLLAKFWSQKHPTPTNILLSLLIISPLVGLVFLQPDLGTAITILFIWFAILLGSGVSIKNLSVMLFSSFILAPLGWYFLKEYQKQRILTFLSPTHDPLGSGYNVIQSIIAVGSGQIFGRGIGRGTQSRLKFLPEFRTDFIFASIAEELGFLGSLVVLILYGVIISRCLRLANRSKDRFEGILIFGVTGMLFSQVIINIGMNLGILPVTGITLPLLSYGGSSLICSLVALAMVASPKRVNFNRDVDT